ncbi:MAG: hypothetical protein ACTSP5_07470 [Candidatus Heimdallarchaeota archaeon]
MKPKAIIDGHTDVLIYKEEENSMKKQILVMLIYHEFAKAM